MRQQVGTKFPRVVPSFSVALQRVLERYPSGLSFLTVFIFHRRDYTHRGKELLGSFYCRGFGG